MTMKNLAGTYIKDGGSVWIVEDVTQGDCVGDITFHPTLLAGHVRADGSTLDAEKYPRLLAWAIENNMLGDDAAHYKYSKADGTLRVPNMTGRVLQSGKDVGVKEAGLPNIKGASKSRYQITDHPDGQEMNGAFKGYAMEGGRYYGGSGTGDPWHYGWKFDASWSNPIYGKSDTVQPAALTMIAQIKY